MKPERYQSLKEHFIQARDLRGPQRETYLDRACAEDASMRVDLERLLAAHDSDGGVLCTPSPIDGGGKSSGVSDDDFLARHVFGLPTGEWTGRYRIRGILGEGGMGVVYEAEQANPNRTVALKVIRPGVMTRSMLARFRHEAQMLGRLQHSGIAQIFEADTTPDGQPFFAMERVDGEPITRYAKRRQLSIRERLELMKRVCAAVEHAHQKGVIHRDLKPDNILVDRDGTTKILDFGVARATDSDVQNTTLQTDMGQLIGTIPYMSPEQVLGDSTLVDTRSDVYALGVLTYELLSGRQPYDLGGRSIPEAVLIIREHQPDRLSSVNKILRGDLETITAKALEKDPTRRYASAAALAEDITRYLRNEPIAARPSTAMYQFRKLVVRHKLPFALVAVLFLSITGFGVWMAMLYTRADGLRAEAVIESAKSQQIQTFLQYVILSAKPHIGRDLTMKEALDEAAERIDAELGAYPEVEAAVRLTLADAYWGLRRHDLAEIHFRRALEINQQLWGDEHESVAMGMRAVGKALRAQSKYAEAEPLFRRSIKILRRVLGDDDVKVAIALNSLSILLKLQRKYVDAEQVLKEALAISRKHPDELEILGAHLANLALVTDDPARKEALLLEALQIQQRIQETTMLYSILPGLSTLALSQGKWPEAHKHAREFVKTAREVLGPDHPEVGRALMNLGLVLRADGRTNEAESAFQGAVTIFRDHWGDDHRYVADALVACAHIKQDLSDHTAAEELLGEALGIRRRILPFGHPDTVDALDEFVQVLMRNGKPDEAEPIMRECLDRYQQRLEPADRRFPVMQALLGECLLQLGRFDEAEPLLLDSYELLHSVSGAGTETSDTIQVLVQLYDAWNRPDHAAEWRARLRREPTGDNGA